MLAIVIPYFKLTFFEATLQSLANQTDKRFKVYIGDDASPESPIFLLENEEELFLRLFYKEDRQKLLKPPKSSEKLPEKPDQRNREKFLSILGKLMMVFITIV